MNNLDLNLVDTSFEICNGVDGNKQGHNNFEPFSNNEGGGKSIDWEKAQNTFGQVVTAGASVIGTVKAFQDPNKVSARQGKKEDKRNLRDACGMKPLISKKKKEAYRKCVSDYTLNTSGARVSGSGDTSGENTGGANNNQEEGEGMSTTTKVLIGVGVVLALATVGYFIYRSKKG